MPAQPVPGLRENMFGIVALIRTLLGLFWAAILILVGARFIALLANANRSSDSVDWLYRHSDFWVKPFFGMFDLGNKAVSSTGGVFEPASLVAWIVYFVGGIIVLTLITAPFTWMGPRRPVLD